MRSFELVKVLFDIIVIVLMELGEVIFGAHIKTDQNDLVDKIVVIVNYDNSQLGKELRNILLARGSHVFVTRKLADETEKLTSSNSKQYREYSVDTSNYEEMITLKSEIETLAGIVDIVIILPPKVPDLDIIAACENGYAEIVGHAFKSKLWAMKVFMQGMISKQEGCIVNITPFTDRSSITNVLRRGTTGLLEAIHSELVLYEMEYINFIHVKNYLAPGDPFYDDREAALKIVEGLQKKSPVVEIKRQESKHSNFATDIVCMIYRVFAFIFMMFTEIFMKIIRRKPRKEIANQVVLVTGGAMGLGKEIALHLAKLGCNVAIADVDFEKAQKTAEELSKFSVDSKAYKADVSDINDIKKLKENIENDLGSVDILVNNAGIMTFGPIFEAKVQSLSKIIDVNLVAQFLTIKEFLPSMIKSRRGHIVAISSMAGVAPFPTLATYCCTKYAIVGLLNSFEYELKKQGINYINTTNVFPNFTRTRDDLVTLHEMDPMVRKLPFLEPEYVGRRIVETITENGRNVFIHDLKYFLILFNALPLSFKDYLTKTFLKDLPTTRAKTDLMS